MDAEVRAQISIFCLIRTNLLVKEIVRIFRDDVLQDDYGQLLPVVDNSLNNRSYP